MNTLVRYLYIIIFAILTSIIADQGILLAKPTSHERMANASFYQLMGDRVRESGFNKRVLQYVTPESFQFVEVSPEVMRKISPNSVDASGMMSFTMGSPKNEAGRQEDENQVKVKLTRSFLIAKTPLTQLQYFLITGKNPGDLVSVDTDREDYLELAGNAMNANSPISNITSDEVDYILRTIGYQHGQFVFQTNLKFRLPTEAEWEYAVRAGTKGAYFFGRKGLKVDSLTKLANVDVEKLPKNPLGLLFRDGTFNWCSDVYCERLPGGVDPLVNSGDASMRVIRGVVNGTTTAGSDCSDTLRSASRGYMTNSNLLDDVGVRLVMDIK